MNSGLDSPTTVIQLLSNWITVVIAQGYPSLAGHTLSQERVWYFTMQRFVPDPTTFVGCFPPNVYVVCVLRNRVYTLQPLSARTISCTVTYQTLS